MAGRIRSIKPEILEDEKTAALSHLAWRLFVSLWLIADDYGNLRGDPVYVLGQTLWATRETRETIAAALDELVGVGLLLRYAVRGQSYCHIAGWAKHQKVTHPGKPRMPGPAEADLEPSRMVETLEKSSGDPRETLTPDLRPPTSDLRPPTEALPPARDPAVPSHAPEQTLRSCPPPAPAPSLDGLWGELEVERKAVAAHHGIEYRPLVAHDRGRHELADALAEAARAGTRAQAVGQVRHAIAVAGAEARADRDRVKWLTGAIFSPDNFRRLVAEDLEQACRPRAGPRGSAERASRPEPRSNQKPL